jgi:FixJ family two-component response regulator
LIAIVDDDESVRSALETLLASFGYRSLAYDSATSFLVSGLAGSCQCVISDIGMPGMSGFDLTRHLQLTGQALPVILITARNGPTVLKEAEACGAHSLLRKPFEAKQLMRCLAEVLAKTLNNDSRTNDSNK